MMTATYKLDTDGFRIDGYTRAKPFASFLPGIAGLWGIPMWAFYVNRGQAIAGFGIQDKDHPIMEFVPANRAYRTVTLQGFRTFVKLGSKGRTVYEPFRTPTGSGRQPVQRMRIRAHDLRLEELNTELGLAVGVRYFTIPNEPFSGLARILTITNRSRKRMDLELVDGLPAIIPFGMLDRFLKFMSRTIEAWSYAQEVEPDVLLYRLKVEPHDTSEVVPINAGNFYAGLTEEGGRTRRPDAIVDPTVVFGACDDLTFPERFAQASFRVPTGQIAADKTPSAMGYLRTGLRPGETRTVWSMFGHAESAGQLRTLVKAADSPGFFARKASEQEALITRLTDPIATSSRSRAFDLYCRQTFLDNLLRGGAPTVLGEGGADGRLRQPVLYVFCRKHGDLERDYNQFVIPATPFSQGNANFRDVNQNRRADVWFYPEVDDHNVLTFFNLIQADGYNPLVFKGIRWVAPDMARAIPQMADILGQPFTPGELLQALTQRGIKTGEPPAAFLARVLREATPVEDAEHGEGFWTDHWTYNLDLMQSYLSLYPDRLRHLLLEKRVLTFYDNAFVVAPRAQRYRKTPAGIRQLRAVRRDPEKSEIIRSRGSALPHCVRTEHGRGAVYTTTVAGKMVCIIANKLASLDPSGLGVEMEADRPNWYDALNGLPALLGSSTCETFELKRWITFLRDALDGLALKPGSGVTLPAELHGFIRRLTAALDGPADACWDASETAKEEYRELVRLGFSGEERGLTAGELAEFLRLGLAKVERGIAAAYDKELGLPRSYYYHEATSFTLSAKDNAATPTKWTRRDLPLFLEGPVHALRLETDVRRARAMHQAVKRSELYDAKLKMYRVCASLAGQPDEIGRCRTFTPGWLENQSVWLHMEYKYLLELLRCGLYEEFYAELATTLIPNQPPARYGRSILENSSFLASSVYVDPKLHGNGFVARLSGATAEFLQMWLWMTVGREPFRAVADGEVELRLAPVLEGALFDAAGRFSFRLLGRTEVTYRNPGRRPTFGPDGVAPRTITLRTRTGSEEVFSDGVVPAPYAAMIRQGLVASLDVELTPMRIKQMRPQRAGQKHDKADRTESDLSAL